MTCPLPSQSLFYLRKDMNTGKLKYSRIILKEPQSNDGDGGWARGRGEVMGSSGLLQIVVSDLTSISSNTLKHTHQRHYQEMGYALIISLLMQILNQNAFLDEVSFLHLLSKLSALTYIFGEKQAHCHASRCHPSSPILTCQGSLISAV